MDSDEEAQKQALDVGDDFDIDDSDEEEADDPPRQMEQ